MCLTAKEFRNLLKRKFSCFHDIFFLVFKEAFKSILNEPIDAKLQLRKSELTDNSMWVSFYRKI
jgi:hypothetical protein